MTKLFVAGDIFSLTVQGNAAGLTAKDSTQKIGEYIITAGLLIQLIIFGFFVIAAVIFHKRMRQEIAKGSELSQDIPWRQGLKMLYACSALIMLRSIFRVIEYVMGIDGYLLSNEWPMYVFDAALMWSVQVIFFIWFPDKFQFSSVNVEEDGHMLVENESPIRWRRYFDKTLRTM